MTATERLTARTQRALVTNDDGLGSEGLDLLAQAAEGLGLDVTVAAPCWDSSGASASLAAVADGGRVLVERHHRPGGRVDLGVHAAPAFIVRAAMYGAFGTAPDVVLSGIDRGPNTGRSILHSGTVGAALTAAVHGRRALALSAVLGSTGWAAAAQVASDAIEWTLKGPELTVLNVNVPSCAPDELRGVKVTALAPVGSVSAYVSELREGAMRVTYADDMECAEAGSDVRGLESGFVSVTALRPMCEDPDVDVLALVADA